MRFFRRSSTGIYKTLLDNSQAADLTTMYNPSPSVFTIAGGFHRNISGDSGPTNEYLINNRGFGQQWTDTSVVIYIDSVVFLGGHFGVADGIVSVGLAARCSGTFPGIIGYYAKLAGTGTGGGGGTVVSSAQWETGVYEGNDGFGNLARGVQTSGTLSIYTGTYFKFDVTGYRPVTLTLSSGASATGPWTVISSSSHDWGATLSVASGSPGFDGGNAADGNGGSVPSSYVNWLPISASHISPPTPIPAQWQGSGYWWQGR